MAVLAIMTVIWVERGRGGNFPCSLSLSVTLLYTLTPFKEVTKHFPLLLSLLLKLAVQLRMKSGENSRGIFLVWSCRYEASGWLSASAGWSAL